MPTAVHLSQHLSSAVVSNESVSPVVLEDMGLDLQDLIKGLGLGLDKIVLVLAVL
jgi:hypothetical protein